MSILSALAKWFEGSAEPPPPTLQERAEEYFSQKDIQILVSPWGQSRLHEIINRKNANMMPGAYAFFAQPVLTLENIVSSYAYWDSCEASGSISPSHSRVRETARIVSSVLDEGRKLSAEELLIAKPYLVQNLPDGLVGNPVWAELQDKIAAYNETVSGMAVVGMASIAQLGSLYDVGKMFDRDDGLDIDRLPEIAGNIKGAIAVYRIVNEIADKREISLNNRFGDSNVVKLFPSND